jgi:hypothetical protein
LKKIGTARESSLHKTLKYRYTSGGTIEEEIAGFIADGINKKGEFVEVQTGSFGPLKKKIQAFADLGTVNIIHPIIINKYIEVFDNEKKKLYRRKSPKKGSIYDLFNYLLYAPELVLYPALSIELAMVDVNEKRICDGKGSWRRKGISIKDRELIAWHDCIKLNSRADYKRFIPFKKGQKFSSAEFAKKAGIITGLSCKTIYVLKKINMIQKTNKIGRTWFYQLSDISSASRFCSAKRSVTARKSSK